MANHKSAVKEHRQSLIRRERNRYKRARLRTAIKNLRAAVAAGEMDKARGLLPQTVSLIDRTAKTRAIHPAAASRTKSRLNRLVNRSASA